MIKLMAAVNNWHQGITVFDKFQHRQLLSNFKTDSLSLMSVRGYDLASLRIWWLFLHHSAHAGLAAQDNDDFSGLFVKNELSEKTDFNIEWTAALNDRTISIASSYDMSSLQQTGILLPVESNFINTCSTPEASSPATKMKVCQRPKYRPSPPWLPHTTDIAYCSGTVRRKNMTQWVCCQNVSKWS